MRPSVLKNTPITVSLTAHDYNANFQYWKFSLKYPQTRSVCYVTTNHSLTVNSPQVCTPCHEFCSSCRSYGFSIHVCTCKYAQDGEVCVGQCPSGKWRSLVDKTCRPCDGPCPNSKSNYSFLPNSATFSLFFLA